MIAGRILVMNPDAVGLSIPPRFLWHSSAGRIETLADSMSIFWHITDADIPCITIGKNLGKIPRFLTRNT